MSETSLPLSHFRRCLAQFAATSEGYDLVFAGTGITREHVETADFTLTEELLWQICDNVEAAFGSGWYLDLPVIWSLDVQGDLEGAMRFAPNMLATLLVPVNYGTSRKDTVRWSIEWDQSDIRIDCHRNVPIPASHWQMLGVVFALNFETMLASAYPSAIPHVRHHLVGPQPRPDAEIARIFRCPVAWDGSANSTYVQREIAELRSELADAQAYAAYVSTLEARPNHSRASWRNRVANFLTDRQVRPSGADVARSMGLSKRTLDRRLAEEGTSFRQILEVANQREFERLIRTSDLDLASIAERLGYSDESALSRATRRWFGTTAAGYRRQM